MAKPISQRSKEYRARLHFKSKLADKLMLGKASRLRISLPHGVDEDNCPEYLAVSNYIHASPECWALPSAFFFDEDALCWRVEFDNNAWIGDEIGARIALSEVSRFPVVVSRDGNPGLSEKFMATPEGRTHVARIEKEMRQLEAEMKDLGLWCAE